MKLLIVVATKQELTAFFSRYALPNSNFVATRDFDVLITGVGITATAFALGKQLNSSYQLVVNVGIAGSFDPKLPLGTVVQIENDTFAELGAEDHDRFLTINELGLGENSYRATATVENLPKANAITVNKVHGNAESIAKTKTLFDVQIESMEGAAVFYACEKENISCIQVRSISNYIVPRNKEEWKIGLAIKNLNDWLIQFISSLNVH